MNNIKPLPIWKNGVTTNATFLLACLINDNLKDNATFYYSLLAETEDRTPGEKLADGNLIISGEAYKDWTRANDESILWISKQLNVTLA